MRSAEYLADEHHVDHSGNLIACTLHRLPRPGRAGFESPSCRRASSKRDAIPGCEAIRISKPSCFRVKATSPARTNAAPAAGAVWVYCAFIEPETPEQQARLGGRRCRPAATPSRPSAGPGVRPGTRRDGPDCTDADPEPGRYSGQVGPGHDRGCRERVGGHMHIGGSTGDDDLYGGVGDDVIWGGRGDDRLHGSDGDGTLIGGLGRRRLVRRGRHRHGGLQQRELWREHLARYRRDDPVLEGPGAETTGSSAAGPRTRSSGVWVATTSSAGRATTFCSAAPAPTTSTADPAWTRCPMPARRPG